MEMWAILLEDRNVMDYREKIFLSEFQKFHLKLRMTSIGSEYQVDLCAHVASKCDTTRKRPHQFED